MIKVTHFANCVILPQASLNNLCQFKWGPVVKHSLKTWGSSIPGCQSDWHCFLCLSAFKRTAQTAVIPTEVLTPCSQLLLLSKTFLTGLSPATNGRSECFTGFSSKRPWRKEMGKWTLVVEHYRYTLQPTLSFPILIAWPGFRVLGFTGFSHNWHQAKLPCSFATNVDSIGVLETMWIPCG